MSFARKIGRRSKSSTEIAGKAKVHCNVHGRVVWYGDVVCNACGTIYLRDGMIYPTAPEDGNCTCGAVLFPPRDENDQQIKDASGLPALDSFTARIVCRTCARVVQKVAQKNKSS